MYHCGLGDSGNHRSTIDQILANQAIATRRPSYAINDAREFWLDHRIIKLELDWQPKRWRLGCATSGRR